MRTPALSDAVIYTASDGTQHAATIAKVTPGSHAVGLTVHWINGQTVFPLRDVPFSAEGAGDSWNWPQPQFDDAGDRASWPLEVRSTTDTDNQPVSTDELRDIANADSETMGDLDNRVLIRAAADELDALRTRAADLKTRIVPYSSNLEEPWPAIRALLQD